MILVTHYINRYSAKTHLQKVQNGFIFTILKAQNFSLLIRNVNSWTAMLLNL